MEQAVRVMPGFPSDLGPGELLPGLLLGISLGMLYELLRPLRRNAGPWTALSDLLFALLAGAAAFAVAMQTPGGRLGLWSLTAALLGFLLQLHVLSGVKQLCSWFISWIRLKKEKKCLKFRQKSTSKF